MPQPTSKRLLTEANAGLHAADPATPLGAALNATYASTDKLRGSVPAWAPSTAYIQGAPVLAPDGSMVNAVAAFTSGATYDPINWTSSKGAVSEAGTQVGSPPVIKPAGDTRAGVWEYVHNSSVGYLWHLLVGSGTSSGSWLMGIGIDSGLGNGFIFRNKAQGIGLKVENTATISSATAYGMFVEQKSALAPAMNIQQRDEGTATALELISFCDDATAKIMTVNGYAGRAFDIESNSGKVNISKGVEVVGNYVDIREDNGVPVAQRGRLKVNATNGLTWHSPAGTDNQWWPFRITEGGSGLYFQAAGLSATPDSATFTTVIGIKNTQLGFFGVTPASRPAAIAAPTAGTTIDTEARAAINSIRAALTTLGLTS